MAKSAVALVLAVLVLLCASPSAAQCSSTSFCTCTSSTTCAACVVGSSLSCISSNATSTCNGQTFSGSTASNMCNNQFPQCRSATSACNCIKIPGCGFCNTGGPNGGGQCLGGVDALALDRTCPVDQWFPASNSQIQNSCKAAKAKIVAYVVVGVTIPIVFIGYWIFWWCVRGKHWWRSTSHKRCCYSENAACNGCLCFRPYEAQPPPHGNSNGPKATASRVAPCWTGNPCAWCDNLDGWKNKDGSSVGDKYRPLHKCGLGCACACAWMPGACCFKWSDKCLQTCCEDVQDGPIGSAAPPKKGAAAADPAGGDKKKGKWADKLKGKKGSA